MPPAWLSSTAGRHLEESKGHPRNLSISAGHLPADNKVLASSDAMQAAVIGRMDPIRKADSPAMRRASQARRPGSLARGRHDHDMDREFGSRGEALAYWGVERARVSTR